MAKPATAASSDLVIDTKLRDQHLSFLLLGSWSANPPNSLDGVVRGNQLKRPSLSFASDFPRFGSSGIMQRDISPRQISPVMNQVESCLFLPSILMLSSAR